MIMYMNVSPQILNNNNNNNNNIILKHFSPKHNEHILFYFLNKYRMTNGHCIYNCQYVHNVTCQFRYKCLYIYIYIYIYIYMPISVGARSKVWVYGRSLSGIVGSNPAGGMDVCLM